MTHRLAASILGCAIGLSAAACGASSPGNTPAPSGTPTAPPSPSALTALNMPPPRQGAAFAFDEAHGQLVLFGGGSSAGLLSETWTWDGQRWHKVAPGSAPAARVGAGMAYDAHSRTTLLFGGAAAPGADLAPETWAFDGGTWHPLQTARTPVTGQHGVFNGMMAADPATGSVVLEGFGGESGNTYLWTGSDWAAPVPPACPPGFCRGLGGLAFDPSTGKLVLVAGGGQSPSTDSDTWDGHSWALLQTGPPAFAEVVAAASDTARKVVIGATCGGDAWILHGGSWTQAHPVHKPPKMLQGCAMAYDSLHKVTILIGVPEADHSVLSMWAWDGQDWTAIRPG
jgi:hypothetical protein